MTNHEVNIFNMMSAVQAVLTENEAFTAEIPVFAETITDFSASLEAIKATDMAYKNATPGKTQEKHNAEEEVMKELLPIKSALYMLAVKQKDEELKALAGISGYGLQQLREIDFMQKSMAICNAAEARTADLVPYNITLEKITLLTTKINNLNNALSKQDTGFASKSALRKQLHNDFDHADEILKEHLDTLMELERQAHLEFYNKYVSARVILDLGGGHNGGENPPVDPPANPAA